MASPNSNNGMLSLPTIKKGYMNKESRTGLLKNWKQRYFTLELGVIKYFEKISHVNLPPYGDGLKGTLSLKQVTIIDKTEGKKYRILINSLNKGDDDLLIGCENEKEHAEWLNALNYHTKYAKASDKSIFSSNNMNDKRDVPAPTSIFTTGIKSNGGGGSFMSKLFNTIEEPIGGVQEKEKGPIWVVPEPIFVIKCLHEITRSKVFINLCMHESVPLTGAIQGSAKWPHMVSGEFRDIDDGASSEEGGGGINSSGDSRVKGIDVIVNTEIGKIVSRDLTARNDVCSKVIRHLSKYRNEQLNEQYKLPKITRKYKGETQEFLSDSTLANASNKTIQTRNKTAESDITDSESSRASRRKSNMQGGDGNGDGVAAGGTSRVDYMDADADNSSMFGQEGDGSSQATRGGLDGLPDGQQFVMVLKAIPYEIVAANGVMGKINPDKNAQGRVISCGEKVQVTARATVGDVIWLRTRENLFIPERFQGGGNTRLLKPISTLQPERFEVLSANLVEELIQGFSFANLFRQKAATFTTAFHIRLQFPEDCSIKISRTVKDIQKLRKDIMKVASSQLKARLTDLSGSMLYIADLADGNEDILEDPNNMLYCIESVEIFLNSIIANLYPVNQKVNLARRNASPQFLAQVKALQAFLTPKDVDVSIMDIDLTMSSL